MHFVFRSVGLSRRRLFWFRSKRLVVSFSAVADGCLVLTLNFLPIRLAKSAGFWFCIETIVTSSSAIAGESLFSSSTIAKGNAFRLTIRRSFTSAAFLVQIKKTCHFFLRRCGWIFSLNFEFSPDSVGEIGWVLVLHQNHCHFCFRRCGQILGLTSINFAYFFVFTSDALCFCIRSFSDHFFCSCGSQRGLTSDV